MNLKLTKNFTFTRQTSVKIWLNAFTINLLKTSDQLSKYKLQKALYLFFFKIKASIL